MRILSLVCSATMLLGLASCARTVAFTKAGTPNQQQLVDNLACGATKTDDGSLSIRQAALPSYTSCMEGKGYHETVEDSSKEAKQFLGKFVGAIDAEYGSRVEPAGHGGSAQHATVDTAGLAPVGPVRAPGCGGIEIVGYASDVGNPQQTGGMFQNRYFVAIRNNGREAKIVSLYIVRNKQSWQINQSPIMSKIVRGGDLVSIYIDYSPVKPTSVSVTKCM